ncbi:MAG: hypothetical protein CMH63_03455 [Nanoarchaeota archaeon]|nr:hypothetical protein [Nanoarchaeota archaeon]|tara:strand:+ start:1358 stop:1924 length:567 start_codon:yes stop_codon:yes gene_type:complete
MIHNLWQKKPKLTYSKETQDIIQFGSSVMENTIPNDIDIAILFQKIPLKEQLLQAQTIKHQLQKLTNLPIHITPFDLYSLFHEGNFAKENILIYGKSFITKDYFSKKFNLTPKIQISYELKNLKKKDKVRFHYLLKGKKGKYGLLRKYNGKLINPGLIEILPEYEKIFLESIKKITSKFKIKKILIQN